MIALIDNFDSFTWNIMDYLQRCGLECHCFRSNEITIEELQKLSPKGIVLSPGPGRPVDHPLLFPLIEKFIEQIPILGICLGHQAIGEYFGSRLIKSPLPVHGKQSTLGHNGHSFFDGIAGEFKVGRYHSLVLESLGQSQFEVTSTTVNDGLIMSFAHTELPLWGIQFHPESVLTPGGLTMLKNWSDYFSRRGIL
jgi:anthranilate synthase/aminodeoxychorismate synthase-like glutamine amidotransferase